MLSTPLRALAGLAIALFGTLAPSPAEACTCAQQTIREHYEDADAVFEARVVVVEDGTAELRLTRVWKGVADDVEVLQVRGAGSDTGACEVNMRRGVTYVVFAFGDAGELETSICTGTTTVDGADAVLAELGPGFVPVDPDVPPGPDVTTDLDGTGAGAPADDETPTGSPDSEGDEPEPEPEPEGAPPADGTEGAAPPSAVASGGCAHCAAAPAGAAGGLWPLFALLAIRTRRCP